MKKEKKTFLRKFAAAAFLTVLLTLGLCLSVNAASVSVSKVRTVSGGTFVKKSSTRWIYRYKNGKTARNCLLRIKGKTYYFSSDGTRRYGWQKIGKKRYYFGRPSEGWMYKGTLLTYKGKLYCLKNDGSMATGWKNKGGRRYYFSKNGQAYTGKHTIDGVACYFGKDGKLLYTGANLSISSPCAVLAEADTGRIIYAKNADKIHANASTTKIMTCILALENSKMSEIVTASANAAAQIPTKLGMSAGESFRMKDLLYSLMLPSHNDTAVAIAEHIGGTSENFVKMMNQKAKAIGCKNTHFVTPNGLDRGFNHYTTASDLLLMARYAWKKSTFRTIVGTSSYTFSNLNGKQYHIKTTNTLLGSQPGVCGMKTGFTAKAGNCFVGVVVSKNKKTYISVTLGAATEKARWDDAKKLLNYAYKKKK